MKSIEKLIKKIERKGGVVHSMEQESGLSHRDQPRVCIAVYINALKPKFLNKIRKDDRLQLIEMSCTKAPKRPKLS